MPARTGTKPTTTTTKPAAAKPTAPAKPPAPKQMSAKQKQELRTHTAAWLTEWLGSRDDKVLDAERVKVALTADDAIKILGWQEVKPGEGMFTDKNQKDIYCFNNEGNRLQPKSVYESTAIDILNRHWAYNAETITISKNGNVLSGQRRLIALVFAEQMRTGPAARHWEAYWDGPVTIECVVVHNVDDDPATTRTIDNTRPRTVFDSFYTDPQLAKYKPAQRKVIARILDQAIRALWQRTGMDNDKFHSRNCNSDLVVFKDNHQSIVKAVLHVWEEDGGKGDKGGEATAKISSAINMGVAAALMYLMGTSATTPEKADAYRANKPGKERKESALDKSRWEQAETFWTDFTAATKANPIPLFTAVDKVRRPNDDPDDKESGKIFREGTTKERAAVLCKAWGLFLSGKTPNVTLLQLKYKDTPHKKTGIYDLSRLDEDPVCGGIDMGWWPEREEPLTPSVNGQPEAEPQERLPEHQDEADKIRQENTTAAGAINSGNLD